MGYYIEVEKNTNKAQQIAAKFKGEIISQPLSFADIPEDKALIVCVDNGLFEAAGLVYDQREFDEFIVYENGHRNRPREYVLLDKQVAHQAAGYKEKK